MKKPATDNFDNLASKLLRGELFTTLACVNVGSRKVSKKALYRQCLQLGLPNLAFSIIKLRLRGIFSFSKQQEHESGDGDKEVTQGAYLKDELSP